MNGWMSYTYGVLPPKRMFMKHYKRILGDVDAGYRIVARAPGALGAWDGSYDAEDLWERIKEVTADPDAWDSDAEDAPLDVVSSILFTLEIEWI